MRVAQSDLILHVQAGTGVRIELEIKELLSSQARSGGVHWVGPFYVAWCVH